MRLTREIFPYHDTIIINRAVIEKWKKKTLMKLSDPTSNKTALFDNANTSYILRFGILVFGDLSWPKRSSILVQLL